MRAWVTQATVRALFGEGCGDPSLTTVFYDPGRIGLPHPARLIRQKLSGAKPRYKGGGKLYHLGGVMPDHRGGA